MYGNPSLPSFPRKRESRAAWIPDRVGDDEVWGGDDNHPSIPHGPVIPGPDRESMPFQPPAHTPITEFTAKSIAKPVSEAASRGTAKVQKLWVLLA